MCPFFKVVLFVKFVTAYFGIKEALFKTCGRGPLGGENQAQIGPLFPQDMHYLLKKILNKKTLKRVIFTKWCFFVRIGLFVTRGSLLPKTFHL